jgi:hypothetical protein
MAGLLLLVLRCLVLLALVLLLLILLRLLVGLLRGLAPMLPVLRRLPLGVLLRLLLVRRLVLPRGGLLLVRLLLVGAGPLVRLLLVRGLSHGESFDGWEKSDG